MIPILLIAFGYGIGWCINNTDKVKGIATKAKAKVDEVLPQYKEKIIKRHNSDSDNK